MIEKRLRLTAGIVGMILLSSCSSVQKPPVEELILDGEITTTEREPAAETKSPTPPTAPQENTGKYYLDDGPPSDADKARAQQVADAVVRWEPIPAGRNRPYVALGKRYVPYKELRPYRQRGEASWYGKRYHGRKTASGETYDMFGMTAAHPILPLPSYVRVTRINTGKSVVVRVNDRGPFLGGRLIDLSYAAAARLEYVEAGVAEVEVELILPPNSPATDEQPATAPAPTEVPADADTASGIYIQLAAYSSQLAAADFMATLQQEIPPPLMENAVIYGTADGLFFVQIGPYETRQAATADDEMLCREYNRCGFLKRR